MSLTRVLADVDGPVRRWFESRLPNLKPMRLAWRAAGRPIVLCPDEVKPGIVGAAFDYRLRYFFGATPAEQLVAAAGAGDHEDWPAFAAALDATVDRLQPAGRALGVEDEAELARYCWVLAVFESHFRMGGLRYETPIDALGPSPGIEALLGLAPAGGIEDLGRLVSKLQASPLAEMLDRPFCLNPKFRCAGRLVGGADADLLVDGLLVEVKTTKNNTMKRREDGYQLLGYLLLDQHVDHEIDSLGFYLSRIPTLMTWPVAELLEEIAGGPVDLADLRAEFAVACRAGADRLAIRRS
ncbi:MAG: hypothetical protein WKF86_11650 [Acidimicrobiales bacterium]